MLGTRAALLQADGNIVDTDGITPLSFEGLSADNYYIAVHHRNHLSVMSLNTIALSDSPATLDFRTASTYGTDAQKEINGNKALWSGDASPNGSINAADRSETWNNRNQTGYLNADCDLDGNVNASDRSSTWNHRNTAAQLP